MNLHAKNRKIPGQNLIISAKETSSYELTYEYTRAVLGAFPQLLLEISDSLNWTDGSRIRCIKGSFNFYFYAIEPIAASQNSSNARGISCYSQ